MTREVHEIPPAPRQVRWRSVLWHRWPLALCGFVLGVYGGLIALMLHYAASSQHKVDASLDQACQTTNGRVVDVVAIDATHAGKAQDRIQFEFDDKSIEPVGQTCFADRGKFATGQPATIEYAQNRGARLAGSLVELIGDPAPTVLGLVVFPGFLLILLWLQGVFDLRRVLGSGDAAVADLESIRQLRIVTPTMFEVQYRFRDRNAQLRTGRHWVRARSELGERIAQTPERLVLVHDRKRPHRSRLVIPTDFAVPPPMPVEENVGS